MLSSDELNEIAKRMVETTDKTEAEKLKEEYIAGFYGKPRTRTIVHRREAGQESRPRWTEPGESSGRPAWTILGALEGQGCPIACQIGATAIGSLNAFPFFRRRKSQSFVRRIQMKVASPPNAPTIISQPIHGTRTLGTLRRLDSCCCGFAKFKVTTLSTKRRIS
jgi:hypothetical protein